MSITNRIHKTHPAPADVLELIKVSEPDSISIYLSTHRTGEEVLQRKDAKTLDGILRDVEKSMLDRGGRADAVKERLQPLKDLVREEEFWRHRTEGLVVLSNGDTLMTADLPFPVKQGFRISEGFYLLPLAPLLSGSGNYYLLALELERIRLFKASREGFSQVRIEGLIPESKEDRVGYDFEQKSLQFRSQQQHHGVSGYHGHDEADSDRKNEIARYFRDVDKGLHPILNANSYPLLIASQTYLAAIYREAASYAPVVPEHLVVNLSEAQVKELHDKSWELMAPIFEKDMTEKWSRFEQLLGTGKASAQLAKVIAGAREGKVDSLFIEEGADIQGVYDADSRDITLDDISEKTPVSLLNLALCETIKNGGSVYVCAAESMPEGSQGMAALFRY